MEPAEAQPHEPRVPADVHVDRSARQPQCRDAMSELMDEDLERQEQQHQQSGAHGASNRPAPEGP